MKRSIRQHGLHAARAVLGSAALLLPLLAETDSHLQPGAAGAALRATAHIDFKIVIPQVLYLDLDGGTDRVAGARGTDRIAGAQTVAIMSNSHNVTLAATVRTSDDARGNVILSAAARQIIAQDAACNLGLGSSNHNTLLIVCTASMP
ncbi:MAG: hypothetical protein ACLP2F_07175 [Steroidobacteraceae bacterium]